MKQNGSHEEWNRSSLMSRYARKERQVVFATPPALRIADTVWDIIRYTLLVLFAAIGIYMLARVDTRELMVRYLEEALSQARILP